MTGSADSLLQQLLDREAIRDCLYRFCRGIDRIDEGALRSAYWPDGTGRHGAFVGGGTAFIEATLANLRRAGARTNHLLGNILIDLRGDVAGVESYFRTTLGGVDSEGKPLETLLSGRYVDRFERRHGEWRVAHRTVVYDWVHRSPLPPEMVADMFGTRLPTGEQKPDDPIYELLGQAPFTH